MKKRSLCIVHIGMPKTGTSAIQEYFFSHKNTDVSYANLPQSNHSGRVLSLFLDKPEEYHYIYKSKINDLNKFLEENKKLLETGFLEHLSEMELISGEDIYHLPVMSPQGAYKLKEFLACYFDKVLIVAYVRPISSFISSAFQQLVKYHELGSFNSERIYHRYSNFKFFRDVFGVDNVMLWTYDPKLFQNFDVVLDFCKKLNIECPKSETIKVNESISKGALSILFTYHYHRKAKSEFGDRKFIINNKLVELLRGVQGEKFKFSGSYIKRVIEANQADYDWILSVMGDEFRETTESLNADGVDNEHELMYYSVQYIPKLVELAGDYAKGMQLDNSPQTVARLVDKIMLRLAHDYR